MIDSHCHFDFPEFDEDREFVWQRAQASGVKALLLPATESCHFRRTMTIAEAFSDTYFALGLHPWFLTENLTDELKQLATAVKKNISNQHFIAIGETGLDFSISLPEELQVESFNSHLQLAMELQLPVIVHHRRSHNKIIELIKRYPGLTGVIHAFSGSEHIAETYVESGFKLGIGGTITYDRAQKTLRAIKLVGLSHLLLETDAPSMPVQGKQGQRNSPEYLPQIAGRLAHVLEIEVEQVVTQTSQNFASLFRRAEI